MFDVRDLSSPIIGAPMAGGATTAALAAAVARAGGLGLLAAGYKSVEAVAAEIGAVRSGTSQPFGVNLFVVEPYDPDPADLRAYADALQSEASLFGVSLGNPRWHDDSWQGKVDLLLETRPAVAAFTFGCPTADVLRRLRDAGVFTMVTVTTLAEAREAVGRGAASLSVQVQTLGDTEEPGTRRPPHQRRACLTCSTRSSPP